MSDLIQKTRRVGGEKRKILVDLLKERDGFCCCYCGRFMDGDETVEHFLSLKDGGNNSLANTALAHEACNSAVASLSVMEKIRLRDLIRQVSDHFAPFEQFDIRQFMDGAPQ